MKSEFVCTDCKKLQAASHGQGKNRERCAACTTYAAENSKRRGSKNRRAIELADYVEDIEKEQQVIARRIKKSRESKNSSAVSVLQAKHEKARKKIRAVSKNIDPSYLGFTRQQFVRWRKKPINQRCHFCHITDKALSIIAGAEEQGNRLQPFVGIDRIDYSKPYTLKNIVPCCERCDAMRSKPTGFTFAELEQLGPTLKKLWVRRLNGV